MEDGGGGVLVRSCAATVSAVEDQRTRVLVMLTVIVDGVCIKLGVMKPSRLREVLLCACAKVVVLYAVWGHRRRNL